jgi:hypothetical protein
MRVFFIFVIDMMIIHQTNFDLFIQSCSNVGQRLTFQAHHINIFGFVKEKINGPNGDRNYDCIH